DRVPATKLKTGDLFDADAHAVTVKLVLPPPAHLSELLPGLRDPRPAQPLVHGDESRAGPPDAPRLLRPPPAHSRQRRPGGARHLGEEIHQWKPGGIVETRAREVLESARRLLDEVRRDTIWDAIGRGAFADVKRTRTGGKGHAGVVERHPEYVNPILEALER